MDEMNKDKFKDLSYKAKLQWFVEYYGVKTVVIIGSLIVIFILLRSVLFPEKYDANVMILDTRIGKEEETQILNDLQEKLQMKIRFCSYTKLDENQMQAFSVKLMSEHLDLVIVPKTEADEMEQNGYWLEKPVELTASSFYTSYRIPLEAIEEQNQLFAETMYIGIPKDCENINYARKLLLYLTKTDS